MQDTSLQQIGTEFNCDKFTVHKYGDVYERYFGALRHQPIRILEIGIGGEDRELGGASLKTWERYFSKAHIVGLDLYDKSELDTDRVKTLVMDQSDQEALEKLWHEHGPFDIVIDDGSHVSEDILRSFFKLFHLLAPGGIYVIEDTQTGYWPHYGGTSINQNLSNTSIAWIKRMIDCINVEEILWRDHPAIRAGFKVSELHVHRNIAFIIRGDEAPKSNVLTEALRAEWLKHDFEVQGLTENLAGRLNNDPAAFKEIITQIAAMERSPKPEPPPTDSDRSKHAKVAQGLFAPPFLKERQRTYVIMGNGRGGTSMVAGVVAALGLPITSHKESINFEDGEIVNAAQGRDVSGTKLDTTRRQDIKNLKRVIEERSKHFDVWGWKDPSADLYLEDVLGWIRDPHFIFVWRDLAAVAGSVSALTEIPALDAFEASFSRYERYWQLLKKLRRPTLMVSYERGRTRPGEMAREIAAFTGLEYDDEAERKVLDFVSPTGRYRSLA